MFPFGDSVIEWVISAAIIIYTARKVFRYFKQKKADWKESTDRDRGGDVVATETYKLHQELISKGVSAEAKILKIWDRVKASYLDDTKDVFLILEIDREDGEPYQIKKYRPWLPPYSPYDNDQYPKPYFWNFHVRDLDAFEKGASFPIRVHPDIPELLDFEVNFYDRDALPKRSESDFVVHEDKALRVQRHHSRYPDEYGHWKKRQLEISSK